MNGNIKKSQLLDYELNYLHESSENEKIPASTGVLECYIESEIPIREVLRKAKQLMYLVARLGRTKWPSEDDWLHSLPNWFLEACAIELSNSEAEEALEAWRKLSDQEKKVHDRTTKWTALNWLYLMHPDERHWYWIDSNIINQNKLIALIAVDEWPFAWGTLSWLFRVSGAVTAEFE